MHNTILTPKPCHSCPFTENLQNPPLPFLPRGGGRAKKFLIPTNILRFRTRTIYICARKDPHLAGRWPVVGGGLLAGAGVGAQAVGLPAGRRWPGAGGGLLAAPGVALHTHIRAAHGRRKNIFYFFLRFYFVESTKKIKNICPVDEFWRRRYAGNTPDGAAPRRTSEPPPPGGVHERGGEHGRNDHAGS